MNNARFSAPLLFYYVLICYQLFVMVLCEVKLVKFPRPTNVCVVFFLYLWDVFFTR